MIARLTKALPHPPLSALAAAVLALLCACGGPTPPAEQPSVTAPVYVGEVTVVNRDSNFVLINVSGRSSPLEPGTDLTAIAEDGEATRLKVSAERKRPFVTADVVSGNPKRGQRVYR